MPTTAPDTRRSPRQHLRLVRACTSCELADCRTSAAAGDGPLDARLVVIAPAPRRHEDLQGRALAGGARNVLDAAIIEAGVDPETVRVTSVVRCRPPDDRAPSLEEVRACAPHLEAELELLAPEVIVTLGPLATAVMLGRPVPFDRVVGFRLDIRSGTTLIPTHHPLDVLRGDKQATNGLRRDLGVAAAVLDGRMKSGAAARDELRARLG